MIYPQKNKLIGWFFHYYIHYIIGRNFQQIDFEAVTVAPDKSVLMLANHFSWWDGFLIYWLNARLFKKKLYVMVLEETMAKTSFMKYLGAFSVKKNSRSVIDSLNFAASLLNDPQNMVLIFPQGRLYSNFTDAVYFENGLAKIIKQTKGNFQLVFAVTFIENFKYKKPVANLYLANRELSGEADELQKAYQEFYTEAKTKQTQIIY